MQEDLEQSKLKTGYLKSKNAVLQGGKKLFGVLQDTETLAGSKEIVRKNRGKMVIASLLLGYGIGDYAGHNKHPINFSDQKIERSANKEITSMDDFIKYLESGQSSIGNIDRAKTLGRYLRLIRYQKSMHKYADEYGIPYDYYFGLAMVEGQGNPASINERDGGAGLIHFQPDVFKRVTNTYVKDGKELFTDKDIFAKYDYDKLSKEGQKKKEIYKKHGELLEQIIYKRGMHDLGVIDQRFNYNDILEATAAYLQAIKEKSVDKKYAERTKDPSRDKYKNDKEFDFKWMLTLNGFNKGPNRFDVDFADDINYKDKKKGTAANHINNIKNNIRDMRYYQEKLEKLTDQGLTGEEIIAGLANMSERAGKTEDGLNLFQYKGPHVSKMQILLNFNMREDIFNKDLYKPIGFANIIDKNGNEIKAETISDRDNVYIKVKNTFELQKEKDSKGNNMFKYNTKKDDAIKSIVRRFNVRNANNGTPYVHATDSSVTDINGNVLKKINSLKQVIIKTKPTE